MQQHVWWLEQVERASHAVQQAVRARDLAVVAALHSGAPVAEVAAAALLTAEEVSDRRRRPAALGFWLNPVARDVAAAEAWAQSHDRDASEAPR